jgi:hypothetical protein
MGNTVPSLGVPSLGVPSLGVHKVRTMELDVSPVEPYPTKKILLYYYIMEDLISIMAEKAHTYPGLYQEYAT